MSFLIGPIAVIIHISTKINANSTSSTLVIIFNILYIAAIFISNLALAASLYSLVAWSCFFFHLTPFSITAPQYGQFVSYAFICAPQRIHFIIYNLSADIFAISFMSAMSPSDFLILNDKSLISFSVNLNFSTRAFTAVSLISSTHFPSS